MRRSFTRARGWAWKLGVPIVALAAAGQLALTATSSASVTTGNRTAATIAPAKVNNLDCNGWSKTYKSVNPGFRKLCADPYQIWNGQTSRFYDNKHYVGHDEPSVKFISSTAGSGNTMSYGMRIPMDPAAAPTASGSVTDYGELSVAPWFGLPICDPKSYPMNACTPDSDTNTGLNTSTAAGSAFMELQFYPPGFTPFIDSTSCSKTQWCAALTIDSLECSFNFTSCNGNCIEPVNFAFLQSNGVPAGPPNPQAPSLATEFGNANTLKMNPGDSLTVSLTDPSSGLTATVKDLTTGKTGFMQASATNGFADTNMSNCSGSPFTFHAEYSTAKVNNRVPWAALEGGVLMQQEIGHGESCNSVSNTDGFSATLGGGTYSDPKIAETCVGGAEGSAATGEGPCNTTTGVCTNATTQGPAGPVACPNPNFATSTDHCEFADGFCLPKGNRSVTINGVTTTESARVAVCYQNQFQNGDLDYDGNSYRKDWPNGSANFPQPVEYTSPRSNGHTYAQIQFETDGPGSEQLCNVSTGIGCVVPPTGAKFYPFWSLNNKQTFTGAPVGTCIWNFGQDITAITLHDFSKDKQYGSPDLTWFGGTAISKVMANPTLTTAC
ncbi:MAG TPA: hypothetical protein VGS19_30170 [Streptosporangiaceae bacterium]|nr:hypothetical protein [Streptosporangiaceae bacterium]